jgi:hypothetical protein
MNYEFREVSRVTAFQNLHYTALNDGTMADLGQDLEGSGYDLTEILSRIISGGTEEDNKTLKQGIPSPDLYLKPGLPI